MNESASRPNILWICTDRQRWDTLGCYGNPWVTTPHLDAMGAAGAVMQQAWSQCPICGPSRASFLTGRYPRTTRLNRNGQSIPPDERVISRLLADAGYVCGHAGKYHLAAGAPGFADWTERRTDDGYVAFDWSLHPPATPVSQYTAWLHEHGVEFKREPVEDCQYVTFGMPAATSNTGWIAQRAINFIHVTRETGRPWFFTCNIEDPHNPFDPPREFLEPYLRRLDDLPLPRYTPGELDHKPIFQRTDRAGVWGGGRGHFAYAAMRDRDHRLIRAAYWAMIDHIDHQVGRMLAALRDTGQLDNTLVLFMSDHGEMLGDHGFYFQGPYFYPEMQHVPLLFQGPGIVPGTQVPALVELVDIAPTLLEAAGLPRYDGMQGQSFWPLLSGQAPVTEHRPDVYFEYYQAIPGGHKDAGGAYITGCRDQQWALSCAHGRAEGELYDLQHDPGEVVNRWDDPAYVTTKARMLKRLCDRMAGTIDPLPPCVAKY